MKGHRPPTLAGALHIRGEREVLPVAGATDLMVGDPAVHEEVLFLDHLRELREITGTDHGMEIGAAATLSQLSAAPAAPDALKAVISEFASPAIRNRATIAGNICNASPAADLLPFLYLSDAHVVLARNAEDREIPVSQFVTGPGTTLLQPHELVTRVIIPSSSWDFTFYRKVASRRSNSLSKLSLQICAKCTSGRVERIAVAFGGVAPTVVRVPEIEQFFVHAGREELAAIAAEAAASYGPLIVPIDDQRSTARYRKHTALALFRHAAGNLLARHLETP